jgi:hypothetical protein
MGRWDYIFDYDSIPFDRYIIIHSYPFSNGIIAKRYNSYGTFEQDRFIIHGIEEQAIYDYYMSDISFDKIKEIREGGQLRVIPRSVFLGYYVLTTRDCGLLLNYVWMSDTFKRDIFGR